MKADAGEDIISERVEAREVFFGKEARYAIGIEFGLCQVGLHDRIERLVDDDFFRRIFHPFKVRIFLYSWDIWLTMKMGFGRTQNRVLWPAICTFTAAI